MTRTIRFAMVAALALCAASAAAADGGADKAPGGAGIPTTPSRTAVTQAMSAVAPAVRACGQGQTDLVQVRIVFEGRTGAARVATVQSSSVSPEVVRCVERAAGAARLPPFTQETFSVSYPFRM